jgi:ribosomal-protein-serine acetyltransferase
MYNTLFFNLTAFMLITYGFKVLGLHRIEIKTATNNLKSQAIPEKLNFKKEGILREAELVNNKFLDLYLYSILSFEWM